MRIAKGLREHAEGSLLKSSVHHLSYSLNSLERCYVWDSVGDNCQGYQGDTRSLNYSSFGAGAIAVHGICARVLLREHPETNPMLPRSHTSCVSRFCPIPCLFRTYSVRCACFVIRISTLSHKCARSEAVYESAICELAFIVHFLPGSASTADTRERSWAGPHIVLSPQEKHSV